MRDKSFYCVFYISCQRLCMSFKFVSTLLTNTRHLSLVYFHPLCQPLSEQTWCSQVVRRYNVRMWQSVESAVSSTDAAGILHTAMPVWPESRQRNNHKKSNEVWKKKCGFRGFFNNSKQQNVSVKAGMGFQSALTQFPSWFDIYVVVAASDSDNDAKRFKLFQVFFHQSDGVVHQSSYSFVQHLAELEYPCEQMCRLHHEHVFILSFFLFCFKPGAFIDISDEAWAANAADSHHVFINLFKSLPKMSQFCLSHMLFFFPCLHGMTYFPEYCHGNKSFFNHRGFR